MRKRLAILGTTAAVGIASIAGVGVVSAATNNPGNDGLSARIAQKFNLNQSDVQQVITNYHQEERSTRMDQQLQTKVDNGMITADQKTKLETELKAIDAKRDAIHDENLTAAERKTKMDALHTELEQWAKDNGIDLSKVMPMGKGMGGGRMMMGQPANTQQ